MTKYFFGKKINYILLALLLCISFTIVGCSKEEGSIVDADANQQSVEVSEEENKNIENEEPTSQDTDSNKVLLVTGEYTPYTSEQLEGYGFFTEIVEAALKDMGIEYEIAFYPWQRCREMVEKGEAWASFPYGHTEEHAQLFLLSNNIYPNTHRFFYLKDNEKIKDEVHNFKEISDFKDYTFGGANGYWYGTKEDFEAQGVSAEWTNDVEGLIQMLYNKRIDFFIEDEAVCMETIKKIYPDEVDKFSTLENPAKVNDYLLIISRSYPNTEELLEKFNASLETIKENGEYDRIIQ